MNTTLQIRLPWEGPGDIKGANSSLPRVYSGQRMYGALDISTQTGNEPVFDAAEIVFEGSMLSPHTRNKSTDIDFNDRKYHILHPLRNRQRRSLVDCKTAGTSIPCSPSRISTR